MLENECRPAFEELRFVKRKGKKESYPIYNCDSCEFNNSCRYFEALQVSRGGKNGTRRKRA